MNTFTAAREVHVTSAGGVCPYQAWGTYRGLDWYLRARHDSVSVSVAESGPDSDPVTGDLISEVGEWMVFPGDYHEENAVAHVRAVIDNWLRGQWMLEIDGDTIHLDQRTVDVMYELGLREPSTTPQGGDSEDDTVEFAIFTYPDTVPTAFAQTVMDGIVAAIRRSVERVEALVDETPDLATEAPTKPDWFLSVDEYLEIVREAVVSGEGLNESLPRHPEDLEWAVLRAVAAITATYGHISRRK